VTSPIFNSRILSFIIYVDINLPRETWMNFIKNVKPVSVAALPKAREELDVWNTRIVGSIPTQGKAVHDFVCCAVLYR
jgi:hypothetical protein